MSKPETLEIRKNYRQLKREGISFDPDQNKTVQSEADRCDINAILRRYDKTGLITHVNKSAAMYGDFTEVNEYQQNLNMIKEAQDSFMELPSAIRKRFDNDPGKFFEFVTNPANADEMIELGLRKAPEPEPTQSPQAEE